MNLTEKKLETAVKELEVLLAAYMLDNHKEGTNESKNGIYELKIYTWEVDFGGVRIAEIAVNSRCGGSVLMRSDVIDTREPVSSASLFLAAEGWLVGHIAKHERSGELRKSGETLMEDSAEHIRLFFQDDDKSAT